MISEVRKPRTGSAAGSAKTDEAAFKTGRFLNVLARSSFSAVRVEAAAIGGSRWARLGALESRKATETDLVSWKIYEAIFTALLHSMSPRRCRKFEDIREEFLIDPLISRVRKIVTVEDSEISSGSVLFMRDRGTFTNNSGRMLLRKALKATQLK
ncbi:hypothetical protein AAC387_Pa03g4418 [Persea americana]